MDRVRVTHLGGDAFAVELGGHRVVVDQPPHAGGDDRGPTPTSLFVASLASCAAFFAGRFLRRHVAAGTALEVTGEFEMSPERPSRVRRLALTVDVDAPLGAEVEAALARAIAQCTVLNTIRSGLEPDVSIRSRAPATG